MNPNDPQPRARPLIIPRSEHNISRANVSSSALKVLYRLKKAGYAAYLVGGGVRDLMLDLHPKDFDVVTDAPPDEIRDLFRNCRLIGRRFRLAHIRFGREIVEVATFRAGGAGEDDDERLHAHSGRIIRDNVYGTIDEDIWRRDFTVNALYYNIADFTVLDYTTGVEDIRNRVLRLIGDPLTRYREDPVRMLRGARLAAKLRFEIAAETAAPIRELGALLGDVPPARLYEELLKLFHGGYAVEGLELLLRYDLFRYLFPATNALIDAGKDGVLDFIREGLRNTDERVRADKPVTPMFLFAVLLWPPIRERARALHEQGVNEVAAWLQACEEIVSDQQKHASFPRRFSTPMKEVLAMQQRFSNRRGVRAARLLQHKQFRAAYDFLLVRGRLGEVEGELVRWWTEVQDMPPSEQRKAFAVKRRRRAGRGGRGSRRDSEERSFDAAP